MKWKMRGLHRVPGDLMVEKPPVRESGSEVSISGSIIIKTEKSAASVLGFRRLPRRDGEKMKERLQKLIESSRCAHVIMPYDETETTDWRLEKKPVLESRMLDEC